MTLAQAAKVEAARNPDLRLTRLLGTAATRPDATPSAADPDLPSGVLAWLDDLARASEASGEDYPADVNQRLIYVLLPVRDDPRLPQLGVQPVSARLRKDGTFAANSRLYAAVSSTPGGPKYFRPSNSRIVHDLSWQPTIQALTIYRLTDEAGAEVLSHILDTGRSRWLALDGPTAQRPNGPTAQRPNGPKAQRPNGPTARRPNAPSGAGAPGQPVLEGSRGGCASAPADGRRRRKRPGSDAAGLRRSRRRARRPGRDRATRKDRRCPVPGAAGRRAPSRPSTTGWCDGHQRSPASMMRSRVASAPA